MSVTSVLGPKKNTGASASQVQDPARTAAIQAWAKEQLTDTDGVLSNTQVVVVPQFIKKGQKWIPSDNVVTEHANGKTGFMLVMGVFQASTSNNIGNLRWLASNAHNSTTGTGSLSSAIVPGNLEWLNGFEAGSIMDGRIDTHYQVGATNPANEKQDLHYISAAARELGIPACDAQGNPIYSVKIWEEDITKPKPTAIPVANTAQINLAIAASAGKTN